jgi:hypothetical protein
MNQLEYIFYLLYNLHMTSLSTKLQLAYLKNLYYWTRGSKSLDEPFTFTWEYKIAEFSPTKKQQRIAIHQ